MVKVKQLFDRRYGHVKFRLIDLICTGYFGLVGLLLIFFHNKVDHWFSYVVIHLIVIIIILEIVRFGERYSRNKLLWFIRTFYPIAIVLYGWSEIGSLSRMFFGDFWATEPIIRLDKKIFGVHPSIWFQQFYRPWLDEIMHFFYNMYFLFMPIVGLTFFIKKRYAEAFAAFAIGTGAHISNFILFLIFPTLAPFMTEGLVKLSTIHYSGYLFYEITRITQINGAQAGGTFPSCHVSAALAWGLAALRYERKLGYILLPLSVGVGISTVYLGHHHALDPICGLIWGAISYPIILKIIKKRGEDPLTFSKNITPN